MTIVSFFDSLQQEHGKKPEFDCEPLVVVDVVRTVVGSFVAEVVASEQRQVVVKEGIAKKRFGKEQPIGRDNEKRGFWEDEACSAPNCN